MGITAARIGDGDENAIANCRSFRSTLTRRFASRRWIASASRGVSRCEGSTTGSAISIAGGVGVAFEGAAVERRIPLEVGEVHPRIVGSVHSSVGTGIGAGIARRLAAGPTLSYAQSKRAINNSVMKNMEEQLDLEAGVQSEMTRSKDFIEGITAFVQKRDPQFKGT